MAFRKKIFFNLWISLTLAVLFFYPLIATLYDNSIILQWRIQNTIELIAAIILFSCFFFCIVWFIHNKVINQKIQLILLLVLMTIPFLSFSVHFLSQLGFKESLISLGEWGYKNKLLVLICIVFIIFVLSFLIWWYPRIVYYILLIGLITLSSLNVLAAWTIFTYRKLDTKVVISNCHNNPLRTCNKPKSNVIVLLFDELSYEYLFKNGQVDSRYKNFKQFAAVSDIYHEAKSPGQQTLTAIPGLLMNKRYDHLTIKYDWIYRITKEQKIDYLTIEEKNLFSVARDKGLKTYAVGNYLPYCEIFEKYLDECRSFSEYNYASVNNGFSLINPIFTNFVIWPRQKPQGLIKNIASSVLQRKRIEQTLDFIRKKLITKDAFFLFAHIYLPHLPFVFNGKGFYWNKEPYVQNDINYTRQMEYCDTLLGQLIDILIKLNKFESSIIVVMSDHNYRLKFPGKENKIPMFIKHPYQKIRNDIYDEVKAEDILFKKLGGLK